MTKVTPLNADEKGGWRRRIHLREISGDSDTPLETVGQDLRAARLRRGDDLATVSRALKIRKDHLEALEEDRLEALARPDLCHRLRALLCRLSRPGRRRSASSASSRRSPAAPTSRCADRSPSSTRTSTAACRKAGRSSPASWSLLLVYGAYHLLVRPPTRCWRQPVAAGAARSCAPQAGIAQRRTAAAPADRAPAPTADSSRRQRRQPPAHNAAGCQHRRHAPAARPAQPQAAAPAGPGLWPAEPQRPRGSARSRSRRRITGAGPGRHGSIINRDAQARATPIRCPNMVGRHADDRRMPARSKWIWTAVAMGTAGTQRADAATAFRWIRKPSPTASTDSAKDSDNEHSRLSRHSPAQIAPDHGRQGAGRRRRADHGADHDQHHHRRRPRHHRPDPRHRGSRRRYRARLLPRRRRHQGDEGDHQGRPPFRSWPTSISTTSAPSRRR